MASKIFQFFLQICITFSVNRLRGSSSCRISANSNNNTFSLSFINKLSSFQKRIVILWSHLSSLLILINYREIRRFNNKAISGDPLSHWQKYNISDNDIPDRDTQSSPIFASNNGNVFLQNLRLQPNKLFIFDQVCNCCNQHN